MHTRRRMSLLARRRTHRLPPSLRVLGLPEIVLQTSEYLVEQVYPEWHRACCELRLNVWRIVRGGVAGQHPPQADVDEVVAPVVPGRTIGIHARMEGRIRVRPVSHEVSHRVYQTPSTSPES